VSTFEEAVSGFKAVQQYVYVLLQNGRCQPDLTSVREGVGIHSTDMPNRCLLAYFKK
jgi:hypothetical protein